MQPAFLLRLVVLLAATLCGSFNLNSWALHVGFKASSHSPRATLYTLKSSTNTDRSVTSSDADTSPISNVWELDCYSRPVVTGGKKKLWEVLLTDTTGNLRVCEPLNSSRVNSRELRRVIEEAIAENGGRIVGATGVKTVKFFRGAMFNMIQIALNDLEGVTPKPSRSTYRLYDWLEERERLVYPNMKGYKPTLSTLATRDEGGLDIRTPVKLPDALRGEKYAFVSLPMSEFLEGGGVNEENIGVGSLCPLPRDGVVAPDSFIFGIVVLSKRSKALAAWMAGTEISHFRCDLKRRTLIVEADINTQFLMAKLDDEQKKEGIAFEEGKAEAGGLHFLCVQEDENAETPEGFWLLRDIGCAKVRGRGGVVGGRGMASSS